MDHRLMLEVAIIDAVDGAFQTGKSTGEAVLDALTTGPVFAKMVERADAYFDNQDAECAEELEFDMAALLRAVLGAT